MSSGDHDTKLTEFMTFTSTDASVARQFLEACSWNTQVAMDRFFNNPDPSQFNVNNSSSSASSANSNLHNSSSTSSSAAAIASNSSSNPSNNSNNSYDADAELARQLAAQQNGGMGGMGGNGPYGIPSDRPAQNPSAAAMQGGLLDLLSMSGMSGLMGGMGGMGSNRQYVQNPNQSDASAANGNFDQNMNGMGGMGAGMGGIRAADAAFSEQMLPSGFDATGAHDRRVQHKDSMKNFSNEWQQGSGGARGRYRGSRGARTSNNGSSRARAKQDQLAKMFAEPSYRFDGTLEQAKQRGQEKNAWILVNIQSADDFVSHCLNRDVWNDDDFKSIIESCFILYQWTKEQTKGSKFISLYHVEKVPCLCVIDPNTGRKEHTFQLPDSPQAVMKIKDEIIGFLDKHPNPKAKPKKVVPQAAPKMKSALSPEEELLQQAMMASLQDAKEDEASRSMNNNSNNNSSNSNNYSNNNSNNYNNNSNSNSNNSNSNGNNGMELDTNEDQNETNNNNDNNEDTAMVELEPEPAAGNKDATQIRIRMPGGQMLQRSFLKGSKVEQLYIYVYLTVGKDQGKSLDQVHLFTPMPRQSLDDSKDKTFAEMHLIRASLICSFDE